MLLEGIAKAWPFFKVTNPYMSLVEFQLFAQLLVWALAMFFHCRDHRYRDSLAKGRRLVIEALMLLVKPPTKRFGFVQWE